MVKGKGKGGGFIMAYTALIDEIYPIFNNYVPARNKREISRFKILCKLISISHTPRAQELISEHIVENPQIRFGKPTIKGTRITVGDIEDMVTDGYGPEDVLKELPSITSKDEVIAAFLYIIRKKFKLLRWLSLFDR